MQAKQSYLDYFAECKHYLKMSKVCAAAGVDYTNFMKFMHGGYSMNCLSLEKLQALYDQVQVILGGLIS